MGKDDDDTLLRRIREGLKPLLSDEMLLAKASNGVKRGMDFLDAGRCPGDSTLFDFAGKLNPVIQHFSADGLRREDYLRAAVERPSLFYQKAETIIANIEGVIEHFRADGLSRKDYLRVALKQPALFTLKPDTVTNNIETVIEHFADDGVNRKNYLQAALKQPPLFAMKPETVAGNIEGVTEHFAADGLSRKAYLGVALKQPALFTLKPGTISQNVDDLVRRFAADGLTHKDYLRAAVSMPQLFYQRPETVAGNIDGVAEHFAVDGLSRKAYLGVALKQPMLFTLRSRTVIGHVNLVADLYDQGILVLPESPRGPSPPMSRILDFIIANPRLLCLADDNFALRELHSRITQSPVSSASLKRARKDIEQELRNALDHGDQRKSVPKAASDAGSGAHARNLLLRALVREGMVKGRLA